MKKSEINLRAGDVMMDAARRKVRIIFDDARGDQPIVGLIYFSNDDYEYAMNYGRDGSCKFSLPIIGKWEKEKPINPKWDIIPPWFNWVAIDEDGTEWAYIYEPILDDDSWVPEGLFLDKDPLEVSLRIPFEYSSDWKGDWKKSKVKRPE